MLIKKNYHVPSKKSPGYKPSQFFAILLAIIVLVWVMLGIILGPTSETLPINTRSAETELPLVQIQHSNATSVPQEVVVFGTTESTRKVTIRSQTGGIIETTPIQEGKNVKKNDIIATIALEDRPARLNKAKATLKQRRLEHKVTKTLLKSGHQSETELAKAYANLQSAKAELLAIELDIKHTKIRAPFDGVMQERFVEKGATVKSFDNNIATILDTSTFLLVGHVPEQKISSISAGSIAYATLITGARVEGFIYYVSKVADPATRTFQVEIEVPSNGRYVGEGLTAEIQIPTGYINAHLISSSSLSLSEDGDIGIKSINDDGLVSFHLVTIINDTPDGLWVSGLPNSLNIITFGQAFVKEGQFANVMESIR